MSVSSSLISHHNRALIVARVLKTADQQGGAMGAMMQDLAFAIPGVDEAMGFAEIMKYDLLSLTTYAKGAH